MAEQNALYTQAQERIATFDRSNDQVLGRMAELAKSKDNTERRLAQTRVNLDVAESSNRALLREIQEDRASVARLSTQVARSIGWEDRIAALTLEREEMQQERDAQASRALAIQAKLNATTDKCSRLNMCCLALTYN